MQKLQGNYCAVVNCDCAASINSLCQHHYAQAKKMSPQIFQQRYPLIPAFNTDHLYHISHVSSIAHLTEALRDRMCREKPRDKMCGVVGCDKPAKSRGLCSQHYSRWFKDDDAFLVNHELREDYDVTLLDSTTSVDSRVKQNIDAIEEAYTELRVYAERLFISFSITIMVGAVLLLGVIAYALHNLL